MNAPKEGHPVSPTTAPCQKCGAHVLAGQRGFGWTFLCRTCFKDEAQRDEGLVSEIAEMAPERAALLDRIAELWRGDWSGHAFDGRDGRNWINTATHGDAAALAELSAELKGYEDEVFSPLP